MEVAGEAGVAAGRSQSGREGDGDNGKVCTDEEAEQSGRESGGSVALSRSLPDTSVEGGVTMGFGCQHFLG